MELTFAEAASSVTLRLIASPLTLAFLALAVGTFLLAALQLSWIPQAQSPDVGLALIVVVFPLQALGSGIRLPGRDSIAGTGAGLIRGGQGDGGRPYRSISTMGRLVSARREVVFPQPVRR